MKLTNAGSVPWKLEFSVDSGTAVTFISSATNDSGSALTDVVTAGASNGATKVDVVPAPSADNVRLVDYVLIVNGDSVTRTVTVNLDVNGTDRATKAFTVVAGGCLEWTKANGWKQNNGDQSVGYAINVQALTSSPTDAQTVYFGMLPKAPVTTAAISKVYIPRSGTLKRAEIYCYSGTAGTNESWSLYVRHNNATDYLIATVAAATSERIFSNNALAIPVSAGDYIEIKSVNPTWATNPATTIYGGYVYVE